MKHVFISYTTKDVDVAQSACKALEKLGIECWIAPRDEIGGKNFAGVIVDAINNCKVFLLISSTHILESEHVLSEVAIAFDSKKIILPFKIDMSKYDESYQYYLSRKHWIEAFPEPQSKIRELTETVTYLLSNTNISFDTKNDKGLIEIQEKNKQAFFEYNKDRRYSSCLSIENNDFADRFHRYDKIKRLDVLNSRTGNYSSYRWFDITNVSDAPTTYILHRECGETKAHFDKLRVRAKKDSINGNPLLIESMVDIQPNFIQVFKIHFSKELMPGESMRIFYRLDWPGELNSYFEGELSQSISLTRYPCGTGILEFGVLDCANMYDFYMLKLNNDFFEEKCSNKAILFSASDEPEFANMPDKELKGAYFIIENTDTDKLYRIMYKSKIEEDDVF